MAPGPRPGMSVPPTAGSSLSRGLRGGEASRTMSPSRSIGTGRVGTVRTTAASITPADHIWSGNIRRLWVSEIASIAGDVILGAGLLIWYFQLTFSFVQVSLLLMFMAIPAALVALFAGSLAGIRDTRRALGAVGGLRVALALVVVLIYFQTIVPVFYLLAFGLSLASNLRGALRRGAVLHAVPVRALGVLASGDQIAAGVLAVAGPALATLLYIVNGERIFTIAVGGALCYLIAVTGESRAEPLPDKIRLQRPAGEDEPEVDSIWSDDEDSREDAAVIAAEQKTPVWELLPPPNMKAGLDDVMAGLQLMASSRHMQVVSFCLAALAFVGGILAALEPFFVWVTLHQPPYMLGLLFTATGVGAGIASAVVVEARSGGRFFLVFGLAISGLGLIALPRMLDVRHALAVIAVLGAANVFAIRGGQMALLRHFVPVAQRAVAQTLTLLAAVTSLLGIGVAVLLGKGHGFRVSTLGLPNLLILGGAGLLLCGVLAAMILILPDREASDDEDEDDLDPLPDEEGEEWEDGMDDEGDESRYLPARRRSRYADPESAEYSAYQDAYDAPRGSRRRGDDDDDSRSSRAYRRR